MKIPDIAISRMFYYLRSLKRIANKGITTISSADLADDSGITPSIVRKDLSYFGQFGKRGIGYNVMELMDSVKQILGLNKQWNMAICGVGNLGSALLSYKGFVDQGFKLVAAFDKDVNKVGKTYENTRVLHSSHILSESRKRSVDIAAIAVPASFAQEVVDLFIKARVKTILNFAPTKISVPKGTKLKNVDLTNELVGLTHFLSKLQK